ncbi:hypothetical protein IEQ34_017000 [Dendrobium chrysotoxum]|uniref:Uncharacterized protein n=1 Tax=Dendrobium chrysotoxum TaxID=161865 RepID=A0AAV7GG84_DENCH|nr:hypothetical protein IEQ34_017000 [Dendrobium chrysotoxum]
MPATSTLVGALLGLSTQMYSNALRKLPYMRHPWEHVLGMGLGAIFVNQLVKYDEKLKEDLDKMLEKAKAANERRYFDESRKYKNLTHDNLISIFHNVNGPSRNLNVVVVEEDNGINERMMFMNLVKRYVVFKKPLIQREICTKAIEIYRYSGYSSKTRSNELRVVESYLVIGFFFNDAKGPYSGLNLWGMKVVGNGFGVGGQEMGCVRESRGNLEIL